MEPGVLTVEAESARSVQPLSRACRVYAAAVGTAGVVPLAWAAWSLALVHPHPAWYLLAGMAILTGPLSIRIPSIQASISISEGFVFTSALLFGPAAATAIAAIDGLAVSLWSRRRSLLQMQFGVAESALSVSIASLLFYRLADIPPLIHHPAPLAALLIPLAALTTTYFVLNTVLAGTAVWLENGGAPTGLLRGHLRHVAIEFCVSLALTAALAQTGGNLPLVASVIVIPMLLASYVSSHHVAGRLEDTNRHLAELRRLYNSTIETLAMAIDAKDQVTHGHIRRVQELCTRLATALGAPAVDIQALEAAALLHDLGKLAVPEHILNKPSRLTPVEFDEIKKHVEVGASILSAIEFPFPVVPIVRHHHESWDGNGYPDGLRGTDIPLGARILAVVDCYDALTSDRPYRRRMTHEDAIEIIRTRSGVMYDPAVVDAFVRMHPLSDVTAVGNRRFPAFVRSRRSPDAPVHHIESAAPRRPSLDLRTRALQFVRTVEGRGWDATGHAVAAFVPTMVPDSVAALYRLDSGKQQLTVAGLDRTFDGRIPTVINVARGVTGWVAANRRPIVNADAELDLGEIAGMVRPPLRMCLSVPVLAAFDDLAGVLTVYSPYAFSETDRILIEYIAEGLAGALDGRTGEPPHPSFTAATRAVH